MALIAIGSSGGSPRCAYVGKRRRFRLLKTSEHTDGRGGEPSGANHALFRALPVGTISERAEHLAQQFSFTSGGLPTMSGYDHDKDDEMYLHIEGLLDQLPESPDFFFTATHALNSIHEVLVNPDIEVYVYFAEMLGDLILQALRMDDPERPAFFEALDLVFADENIVGRPLNLLEVTTGEKVLQWATPEGRATILELPNVRRVFLGGGG